MLFCMCVCVCVYIFVATPLPPFPEPLSKIKAVCSCGWGGVRRGWELVLSPFHACPSISFCFFKSTQQVKRQGESIMQIMSLCIMSHDWNMQMSCIIYECQCLSKSVSHNLQSELETRVGAARPSPLPGKLHFPVNAIHAFGRSCVRDSKCSGKARNKRCLPTACLKVCKILQL